MYPSFINLFDNIMSDTSIDKSSEPKVRPIEHFSYYSESYTPPKAQSEMVLYPSLSTKNVTLFQKVLADRQKYPEDIYHFEIYGIKCLIRTAHYFNWNGYVILPKDHIDANLTLDNLNQIYNVLNGISYYNYGCVGFSTISENSYCLLREIMSGIPEKSTEYHTFEFIKSETEYLAKQIAYRYKHVFMC